MLNKNNKNGVENAVKNLTDLLKEKQEYVPAMLALSYARFILKK